MKSLFLSIFLCFSIICNAQTIRFEAEALNIRVSEDSITEYNLWDGWEACNVIVIVNLPNSTINVYSQYEQEYLILGATNSFVEDDKISIEFDALDKDNARCSIELIYFMYIEKHHLYIRWRNLEVLYQMKKL